MKCYSPDPGAAVTALAGRLDTLELHLADSIYAPAAITGQADDAVEEDDAEAFVSMTARLLEASAVAPARAVTDRALVSSRREAIIGSAAGVGAAA